MWLSWERPNTGTRTDIPLARRHSVQPVEQSNRRLIDLDDLRAFKKVALMKSFTSAARALGLPRPLQRDEGPRQRYRCGNSLGPVA